MGSIPIVHQHFFKPLQLKRDTMIQWEHKIISNEYFYEKDINDLGEQGWQLVSVVQKKDFDRYLNDYYFKRPLPDTEFEIAYISCEENDPKIVGVFTSTDGRSLCYVKEIEI